MAAPTFAIGDVEASGAQTQTTTPPVAHQAYVSGDLIIQFVAWDDDNPTTLPTTGVNGETLLARVVGDSGSSAGPTIGMIAWVGDATISAGTRAWSTPNESWIARSIIIPAGEFDAAAPINSISAIGGSTSASTAPTPAWTASATAGGRVIVGIAVDTDASSGAPTDWTEVDAQDIGSVAIAVGYRDAETTASEAIASANWSLTASDSSSTVGLVVNAPLVGGTSTPKGVFNNPFAGPFGGPL